VFLPVVLNAGGRNGLTVWGRTRQASGCLDRTLTGETRLVGRVDTPGGRRETWGRTDDESAPELDVKRNE